MARIIGSDRPARSRDYLQMAGDELGNQRQDLQGGLQIAQETSASLTQSHLDAIQATRQSIAAQAEVQTQQGQLPVNNVFAGISSVMDSWSKAQQAAAQQAMERQKQLSEVEYAQASMLMGQVEGNAQEIVYKKNRKAYEDQIHQVVSTFPNLSPTQAEDLYRRGYSTLKDIDQQIAGETLKGINSIKDSYESMFQSQLMSRLLGTLSRMESPTANTSELWTSFNELVTKALNDKTVDPIQAARISANVYGEALKSYRLGISARAEIEENLSNTQNFLNEAKDAYQRYGDNPQAYRQAIYIAATRNRFPYEAAKEVTDPLFNERAAYEHQQLSNQIYQQQQEQVWEQMDLQEYDDSYIRVLALGAFTDPAQAARVKALLPPNLAKGVDEIVNLMKTAETQRQSYNAQTNAIKQQLANFNAATAGIVAGRDNNASIEKASSMLSQFVELNAQLNPALAQRLQQQIQAAPQVQLGYSDEDRAAAMKEQVAWRNETAKLIEQELTVEAQKLKQVEDALMPYGLSNIDFRDQATMEKAKSDYAIIRDRLAAEAKALRESSQVNPGATQSNFNLGGLENLSRVKSARANREIVLPFKAADAGKLVIRNGRGDARSSEDGRETSHAGLDIASLNGEKLQIISPVSGKVIKVLGTEASGGYGNMIDIKDSRTGVIHRFSHLDSINVSAGQTVKPEQSLGVMGTTGRSSGVHLHYEIRDNDGWGIAGTKDPEIYLAANQDLGSTTRNQPRSDNADLYANAPNPYTANNFSNSIPARAVALNRMAYIIDNTFNVPNQDPIPASEAFTTSNPVTPTRDPGTRTNAGGNSGGNSGTSTPTGGNHGYSYLARNPKHANKINEVAGRLGINGQWLADIIAGESGFTTLGAHGNGAFGLIGFFPRSSSDRRPWINGESITVEQIGRLPFEQQMEYVYKYLKQFGKLKSVQEMAAAVFGGISLLEKWRRNPEAAKKIGDGYVNLGQYIERLGRNANRKYQTSSISGTLNKTAPVHVAFVDNCAYCKALAASGSQIIPHRGELYG